MHSDSLGPRGVRRRSRNGKFFPICQNMHRSHAVVWSARGHVVWQSCQHLTYAHHKSSSFLQELRASQVPFYSALNFTQTSWSDLTKDPIGESYEQNSSWETHNYYFFGTHNDWLVFKWGKTLMKNRKSFTVCFITGYTSSDKGKTVGISVPLWLSVVFLLWDHYFFNVNLFWKEYFRSFCVIVNWISRVTCRTVH